MKELMLALTFILSVAGFAGGLGLSIQGHQWVGIPLIAISFLLSVVCAFLWEACDRYWTKGCCNDKK